MIVLITGTAWYPLARRSPTSATGTLTAGHEALCPVERGLHDETKGSVREVVMKRKVAGTLIIVVGIVFIGATISSKLFSVAPAFERLTADFRPQMTSA